MRRSSSDLKALSREALNGQWGLPVAAYLLIFIWGQGRGYDAVLI